MAFFHCILMTLSRLKEIISFSVAADFFSDSILSFVSGLLSFILSLFSEIPSEKKYFLVLQHNSSSPCDVSATLTMVCLGL
jgi:hypothetical protein